jgi:Zn-finger nucleic acid-binding protein
MTCPRCQADMTTHTLEGHLGRAVSIDLCLVCQSFWFDARESLQLAPASTLKLFELIGDRAANGPPTPAAGAVACPRCGMRLRPTRDMQRATRFEYLNCPRGHGRLTTFFNFLREKDFIRPLSAAQLAELRKNVQSVNCSNCGAPVNLSTGAACTHCGSPLSMLDMQQAGRLIEQLRGADRSRAGVDPALPLQLERVRRSVEAAFERFEPDRTWYDTAGSAGLVSAGLNAVIRWAREKT